MNMLSDLIDDKTYSILNDAAVLDPIRMRNYYIRRKFREYRKSGHKSGEAFSLLENEFPYLSILLLKRIVY
ncbi:MAG: hypothetical protein ACM34K_06580 [Bacillota bacterium]